MENQNQNYVQNESADVEERNQKNQSNYSGNEGGTEVTGDPSETTGDDTLMHDTDEVGTADVDSLLEEMDDKDTGSGPEGEDTGEGEFTSLSTDPDDDDPDDDDDLNDDGLDGDDLDLDEDDSLPEEPDGDDLDLDENGLDEEDDDLIDTDPGYDENDEFLNSTQHS